MNKSCQNLMKFYRKIKYTPAMQKAKLIMHLSFNKNAACYSFVRSAIFNYNYTHDFGDINSK